MALVGKESAVDKNDLVRRGLRSKLPPLLAGSLLFIGLVAAPIAASKVQIFRAADADDFLAGEMDGVSVGRLGKVRLARALDKIASIEEPFVLSASADGRGGTVVGTGNSGKVFAVSSEGTVKELFATKEPEVFSVWVEGSTVYAAGSPAARLYRYQLDGDGEVEMILDTEEQYVWSIARESVPAAKDSGRLLLATGIGGKLLALDEGTGDVETVFDSDDPHLRSMLVRGDSIVVGTVGEGRVLSLSRSGDSTYKARTLYDAAQPEITGLTEGPNGSVFAAAVASEASLATLAPPAPSGDAPESSNDQPATGTRPSGFEGARSVVLEIRADGSVETRGSFDKETVYALLYWDQSPSSSGPDGGSGDVEENGDLWVATGQEGKLYRSRNDELVLERDLDELQLIDLLAGSAGSGLRVVTTNGAGVYESSEEELKQGSYTSKVLDTKSVSQFGTLHYQAEVPKDGKLGFAVRSGQSAFPDETWSEWIALSSSAASANSRDKAIPDLDLSSVPRGRYLQWKADLQRSGNVGPELSVVELSYRQENRKPEITSLEVLDPGVVLVSGSFNPSNQVFEPTSPNRDGIFNSMDKPAEDTKARPKELWKLGYRTVRWKASDPNEDKLLYQLSFRAEGNSKWYTIADEIKKTSWGFDSTVLPDGLYRVRLVASDVEANGKGEERTAEKLSGVVVVDHTAPTASVGGRTGGSSANVITVKDALSPIRKIEVSEDVGEWRELVPIDGMADSRSETVEISADAQLVLLRVTDAAFNSATIRLRG